MGEIKKHHNRSVIFIVKMTQRAKRGISDVTCGGLHRRLMIRLGLLIFAAVLLAGCTDPVYAQTIRPPYWQVIMAEAVSDGYEGMYAVACVIRNRGGDLHAFCGARRKNLSVFCAREGREAMRQAREIENIVFKNNGTDITHGATHFEAVERYGMPKWARGMKVTARIGEHTFFKK